MEEGNLIGFGIIAMCLFFLLPVLDVIVILIIRFGFHRRRLAWGILLVGIAAGALIPISSLFSLATYLWQASKTEVPWPELIREVSVDMIAYFFQGFGLGALGASIVGILASILISGIRNIRPRIPGEQKR